MKGTQGKRIERLESASEIAVRGGNQYATKLAELESAFRDVTDPESAGRGLIDQIRKLHACTLEILWRAESVGRADAALRAIREARSNLELVARLTGQLDSAAANVRVTTVVVMSEPISNEEALQVLDIEVKQ